MEIMASVERRLNKLIDFERCIMGRFGEEDDVIKCERHRTRMMKYLENEIEKLREKGGVE